MSATHPISNSSTKTQIESYLLSELPINSQTLLFGLDFKYTLLDKKGFVNRFKGNKEPIDIDLSCILFDSKFTALDVVWFKQLRDSSGAVRHQGDSLDGKDRGEAARLDPSIDVETIEFKLAKLPLNVSHIVLLISAFNGHPLKSVERGHIYISDDEGNEIFTADLTALKEETNAICIASLSRELDEWRLTFNNLMLNDNKMTGIIIQMKKELASLYDTVP